MLVGAHKESSSTMKDMNFLLGSGLVCSLGPGFLKSS